ncbi:MAG: 50S ribosomal protein L18 [Peptococcaceae bacterium]|nr:50S ribosomal protein L18 [Peptococcaceae bacterium]
MITQPDRKKMRQKKHLRIRKHIVGTPERPRLAVFRSLKHIYAQIIDDSKGMTLCSASTLEAPLKGELENTGDLAAARRVGEIVGKKAVEKGLKAVVFDRGGNLYHGRVKAVADGAREAGLEF